jgi:flavodoxin
MSKVVIYYSLLGHNRAIAEEIAEKEKCEIKEFAPGNLLRVFQFFVRKKKLAKKAKKIKMEIENHDDLIICGPIWAGKPAPAIQKLLENLDLKGKTVSCTFTYTQDYGDTENSVRSMIQEKSGNVKEIIFKIVSESKLKNT